jgi:hypothetical protein
MAQAAKQQVAIAGVVVDDEDAPGLVRWRGMLLDRSDRPHQIGDHAAHCAARLITECRVGSTARKIDDHVDPRQQTVGFAQERFQVRPRGCGADLVQLLQEQLRIALDRIQRVAQIVPQLGLKLVGIGAGWALGHTIDAEEPVHQLEQILCRDQNAPQIRADVFKFEGTRLLDQHLAVADQGSDRRQQLLAHVGKSSPMLTFPFQRALSHHAQAAPVPSSRSIFSRSRPSSTGLVS